MVSNGQSEPRTHEHEQQTGMDYHHPLDVLASWAAEEPNVRAVILTAPRPHSHSIRFLTVIPSCTCARRHRSKSQTWWSHPGDVLAVERLENGDDQPTRLISPSTTSTSRQFAQVRDGVRVG